MSATNIWRSINQNLNSILDKTSVASVYLTSFKDVYKYYVLVDWKGVKFYESYSNVCVKV